MHLGWEGSVSVGPELPKTARGDMVLFPLVPFSEKRAALILCREWLCSPLISMMWMASAAPPSWDLLIVGVLVGTAGVYIGLAYETGRVAWGQAQGIMLSWLDSTVSSGFDV